MPTDPAPDVEPKFFLRSKTVLSTLLLALCGCTATRVRTDHWQLSRVSVGQKMEIPTVTISADGSAAVTGYQSDGGAATVNAAVIGAVTAALQAVK
jgi:hypothetical protein